MQLIEGFSLCNIHYQDVIKLKTGIFVLSWINASSHTPGAASPFARRNLTPGIKPNYNMNTHKTFYSNKLCCFVTKQD